MRSIIYLSFGFLLLFGVGCAVTNYELITDEDGDPVNTSGKAVFHSSFLATIIWPDGMDQFFYAVDQKANGDRTITTYNNHTTDHTYIDWLYCSPDWTGCAIVTAPDPEVGDVDLFDHTYNANCSGFRSLHYLLSTIRYYGECGRARVSVEDRVRFLNAGTVAARDGVEGLLYNLNRNNFSIQIDNNSGIASTLPLVGSGSIFLDPGKRRITVDMTDSLLAHTGMGLADFVRSYGTESMTVTFTLNGISKSWHVGPMDPEKITSNMNVTY